MRAIATDGPGRLLVSLSHGVALFRCANMAERIDVLLGVEIRGAHEHCIRRESRFFPTDSMRPSLNYFGRLFIRS